MNNQKTVTLMILLFVGLINYGQEDQNENDDYVEFNDRNLIVHGVYLGLNMRFGEIMDKDAYMAGLKVAYVANQQFEIGFEGNFLYSEQNIYNTTLSRNEDLIGVYGGLHLEPILFSKSRVNLSFPLLIGVGGVGYIDNDFHDNDYEEELDEDDFDGFVVAEPGVNVLFNVSRYLQLEAGIKYRFTSRIDLVPNSIDRVNGFSAGIGIKVGVFNLGRNRYKKKASN